MGRSSFPSLNPSLRRVVGGFAAFIGLALGAKACSDLTAPAGVNDVSVEFRLDPGQTRVDLIVGDSVRPEVAVMLGGLEQPRARYVFTSSDPNIIRVYANGDSIVAEDRGTATLIVTLVGTTIGSNRINPNSRTADTIVVVAAALTNVVSPTGLTFEALGDKQTIVARSIGRGGRVIVGSEIQWQVAAPGIVSVAPLNDSTAEVTSIGNGGPVAIWAIFRGVDSVSTSATVAQRFSPSASVVVPGATTLPADGISSTSVTVYVRDANGYDLSSGGANVVLALSPSNGTVSPQTASDNGNGSYSSTYIAGTTSGNVLITATVDGVAISNPGIVTLTSGTASQYVVNVSPTLQPVAGSSLTISARLADANGNSVPRAGETVTWTSTGGGAFSSPTSTTDASGVARVTFTTSTRVTQHTVTATTDAISGTSQLIITNAGPPTQVSVTPATTSPVAGSQVEISAQLLDANGNVVPVSGQTVDWTKSDANGALSSSSSTTNSAGIASVTLTTHTVANTSTTITATTGSLSGTSPTITTVAGPATQLTLTQPPSDTAENGVPFPTQPILQLRDANGNAVAQQFVSVTAMITAGGGTLGGVTLVQTDASGSASFADLSISGTSGGRTLRFSASGVSSATAGVTLEAGPAAQMALYAGDGQSATVGSPVAIAPAVIVRDASNNPVAGVNVTFTVTQGGGTTSPPSGSTVSTDASGVAALTSWTLGTTAGSNAVSAEVSGLIGSPVTLDATGINDVTSATASSVLRTGSDSVPANGSSASEITVTLRDQYGNPISGRTVSLDDGGSTSTITAPFGNTSNALGEVRFAVSNTTAETVTYTATANDPGAIVLSETAQVTFVAGTAPTLTSISPTNGERLQTLDVVFTGSGFVSGVSTVNVGPNIIVNSVTVNSSTQLTANLAIGGTASTGARDFSVTNTPPGGGTSEPQSFTVNNPEPSLSGLSPTSGVQGQANLQLVLTGTGFVAGSAVEFTPSADITINSTTVDSPTQITLSISIAATATTGSRDVRVVNAAPGGGTSGSQTFSVNAPPVPSLSSISPSAGDRLQTLNVVFTGTNFSDGVSSVNVPAGIIVNSTIVDSPTQITANLTILETAALGTNSFTVTNTPTGGTSNAQTFTVSNPAPTISSVTPNPVDGDVLLTTIVPSTNIIGTGFISGVTVVDFVSGATINGTVTVDNSTSITVTNIEYPAAGLTGTTVELRITNPGRTPVTHVITVNP